MVKRISTLNVLRGRSGQVLALGVVGTVALAAFGLSGTGRSQEQAAPPPPVPIRTTLAERRRVQHEFDAVGNVESLQEVVVRSQVDGVLTRLLFSEGEFVRRGQLLATIDDRAQRAALAVASAQRAATRPSFGAPSWTLRVTRPWWSGTRSPSSGSTSNLPLMYAAPTLIAGSDLVATLLKGS